MRTYQNGNPYLQQNEAEQEIHSVEGKSRTDTKSKDSALGVAVGVYVYLTGNMKNGVTPVVLSY